MKAILLSFLILGSNVVLADTLICSNEEVTASLESGILNVNGVSLECLETEGAVCTAINFETVETTVLTYKKESNTATLELMPAPGNGQIQSIELLCR
ncbi:hypothetical protein DOM21_15330 [Bacteriovorax stolpii]|uniref:Uncharacterized protein n=1 Tax=Bacteriovorax stolpii TaxID=960 RepID=A0A2K9NQD4_BACTC|nr:hypothetical protein [Bacteriovorax stolpii]AUN97265.1 hypothetical protein C0V70_03895 [Bacteriovorax stolpii]QDK42797.1 hypothetical protein DOM21_15330 [Bacteriovorax stolpii]TDP52435.1 hypothetical protein C8D79_2199 [Bacteriovorax stolpii]